MLQRGKRVWILLKTVPRNNWGICFWCLCIFIREPIPHFRSKQISIIFFVPGNWVLSLRKNLHSVKSEKPSWFSLLLHPLWCVLLHVAGLWRASVVPGLLVYVCREACRGPWRVEYIRPDLFLFHKGVPGASSVITLLLGRQRRSKWGSTWFIKADKENRAPPSASATLLFT